MENMYENCKCLFNADGKDRRETYKERNENRDRDLFTALQLRGCSASLGDCSTLATQEI